MNNYYYFFTIAPQCFHHDLHLCELVAVVLFGRGLARRLHVGFGHALARRVALRLLRSLAPLALRQIDSEDDIRSDESELQTRRCACQPAAHLKKWLFPHRIRSPWCSWTGDETTAPFTNVLHTETDTYTHILTYYH